MVSAQDKKRMKDFVLARLEDARKFNIKEEDESHIILATKPELAEKPPELYIALHNKAMTLSDYKQLCKSQLNSGRYFANIFYKDDKAFMVRLAESANFRGDKSFKNYNHQQLNAMVHLRGLEKLALEGQTIDELAYYQPETERLDEAIRRYHMTPVNLDYSHIPETDRSFSFVVNRPAVDYKLPVEIVPEITDANGIRFKRAHSYKNIVTVTPV